MQNLDDICCVSKEKAQNFEDACSELVQQVNEFEAENKILMQEFEQRCDTNHDNTCHNTHTS